MSSLNVVIVGGGAAGAFLALALADRLVLLGTLGFVLDRLFVLLTRRLFRWYTTAN